MPRPLPCVLVFIAVTLAIFASVSPAHAECAWVVWKQEKILARVNAHC
jgi:hypothetical protein